MAKKGLTQANTLRSNNTTSTGYGIVYADEIIGSRSVKTRKDLDKLPDWVLGKDNKLEKGTTYYVENKKCFYIYTGDGWQKSFKSIGLPVKPWYAYDNDVTGTAATSQILDISKIIKGNDLYVDTQDGIEEQPHPFATIVVYNDEVNKVPIAYITLFESSDPDNPENNTVVASAKVFGVITNHVFPKTPDFRSINYYEGSCRPLDTGSLITNWKLIGGNSIINKVWELNDFSIKGNTIKTSEIDFTTDTLQKFNDSISSGNHVIKTQYSVVNITHDNIVGQMLLIGDSLGHMVTEILTTSAELKNGVIDWNAHSDTEVNTYIRRNHVKEGGTSSIAVGSWSKWTYYSGEGQYNDFKILVAGELSKKVNTSDVVQQTGDSTTSVMSQKAVSHELANLPDEEDLTFVKKSEHNVLRLADRSYAPENFSGKGYKILRKNIVNGKNVLTQDMINELNTIYEIRYDFDLNETTINLPQNCILKFCGGSLNNGKLNGNNSVIEALPVKIFGKDLDILGTFSNSMNYAEWFDLDYEKTLLSFYGIDFIGNYLISKKISVDTGTHRIYLKFHPQSKITVDTTFTNDYLFDIKCSKINDNKVSQESHLVCGNGYIDLSERCGFISFSASDKISNLGGMETVFKDLTNVYHAGKSIDNNIPTYDSNAIVNTAIIKVPSMSSFTNVQLAATRNPSANVPDCGILLNGTDHKINRLTIITRTIGIYNITGNTFIQDCHVWGAPNIAFYITGSHTINNTYGDWALCSFYLKNTSFINVTNHFVIGSSNPSQTDWYQGNNMCMIKHKTPTNVHGIFSYFQTNASNVKILTDDTNNKDFLERSKLKCSYIASDNFTLFNQKYKFIEKGSHNDPHFFKIPIILFRHINRILFYSDSGAVEIYYCLNQAIGAQNYYLYANLVNIPRNREVYVDLINNNIYTKIIGKYKAVIVETYFNGIDTPRIEEITKEEYESAILNSTKLPIIYNNMNFSDYTVEKNIGKSLYFKDIKSFGIVNNQKLSVISIPEYTNVSSYNINAESLCYSKNNNRIARFDGVNWVCDDFATIDVLRKGTSSKRPTLTSTNAGFVYYDTTLKKKILWNGTAWVNLDGSSLDTKKTGTTEERPTNMDIGFVYKDTTLNKLILWEGTKWVNLDGTEIS